MFKDKTQKSSRAESVEMGKQGNIISPPSISLPKGGGAIRGIGEKFAANPVTGTGSMTVPICTSPGRSGFGPQLNLSYDSGSGNGPFGFGWSLTLPSITRKTDKGIPRYRDAEESDVFILSGAEDLVPLSVESNGKWDREKLPPRTENGKTYTIQRYRPRIEGLFARIERWTNQADSKDVRWRSISKDNITTWYGKTEDTRIADPADPSHIFSWVISESYDDKGNAIVYEYVHEDSAGIDPSQAHERNRNHESRKANRYLKRIKYGNLPSRLIEPDLSKLNWMFEVVFDYDEAHYASLPQDGSGHEFVRVQNKVQGDDAAGDRTRAWSVRQDPFSSYRAGFEVRTYRLCRRVLMFHHFAAELDDVFDYLVRSTEFTYEQSRISSFIRGVTQSGYKYDKDGGKYLKKSLPPLRFDYSEAVINEEVHEIDHESVENLPNGLDGSRYQWVDLDGEGLSGILSEQADAWFYKPNLGHGKFGPLETVALKPSLAALGGGRQQLLDLAGDGQLDLVEFSGTAPGFYERTEDRNWESFRTFPSLPNINWNDPNLKFVDLSGDGHGDVLITEDNVFIYYPSLAEEGFDRSERVLQALDEEKGPRLVFADGTQSVYLADLSGDGLSDLARIRNGETCYWPNLGYGRFGAKVTMDNSPWFDAPDLFDQKRIRLADIDGSGTTDIIYLNHDRVAIYRNECGNRWSDPEYLKNLPQIDDLTTVIAMDLLGNGTACLVWSSALPRDVRRPMRYIDLMGGQKPHLLVNTINNLGAETNVRYAPSTKFYLHDKLNGTPWITRLPFPVHVVERVETYDRISRNRFITRYAYHHGYFDGVEREFRGFGMVEQRDTEEMGTLVPGTTSTEETNLDAESFIPPVLTRTWFHTGAFIQGEKISKHFKKEYYREGDPSLGVQGLTDDQLRAMELPDTVLPTTVRLANGDRVPVTLSADEEREACRALKGSILRQEVYALDGTEKEDRPYTVSERNYTIEALQPQGGNRHSVFFIHPWQTIDFDYDRMLYDAAGKKVADPRVAHSMVLEADTYGNVLKSAEIGYGRRTHDPDPVLTDKDRNEQKRTFIIYTESDYTNAVVDDDLYRTPLPAEARTYEILNAKPESNQPGITNLFGLDEMTAKLEEAGDGAHEIPYEDVEGAAIADDKPWRRFIERVRTLYRKNNLTGLSAFQEIDSMALPGESFKLAFTPGLLTTLFKRNRPDGTREELPPDSNEVLGERGGEGGGYVHPDGDDNWWIPTGRMYYSPHADDPAATELACARQHFFLHSRYRDPFHTDRFTTETTVTYDSYDLLLQETQDPLGNRTTAGERDQSGALTVSGIDYRVLQPKLITDPNGNRSAAIFDALGMVAGTAVMGKDPLLGFKAEGDLLDDLFVPDPTEQQITDFLENPIVQARERLGTATTRIIYDLDRFKDTFVQSPDDPDKWQPPFAATLARETHVSDLTGDEETGIQISFSYFDGFGREIQKKIQAEPGPLDPGIPDAPSVNPRWVGSGWTIFNNKGKPVRQYEPFFDDTHEFKFGKEVGVSPVIFYDPAERVIVTLHPNKTFGKVVFDPWRQTTFDVNDTVRLDPRTDPDVSAYTGKYFATQAASWKTWLQERIADPLNPPADSHGQNPEQDAAIRTIKHEDTPGVAFFDSLGRTFLTVADNGPDENAKPQKYCTRIKLDVENNEREIVDAKGRVVMRYEYDMIGNRVHQASMEAGERWTLHDVSGEPLYAWDSRGHQLRTIYDPIRRPTGSFLLKGSGPELLVGRTAYGESQQDAESHNLRGEVYQVCDQAGVVTTDLYDFKGNLLSSTRQLAVEYKVTIDWSKTVPLEADIYSGRTIYDALNRPLTLTPPDGSVIRPLYNEANLLEKLEANLRGASTATPFITNTDYNAKGQRIRIEYGIVDANGESRIKTEYHHDPKTFRLTQMQTTRDTNDEVQALEYFYDPAGNINFIRDNAQQTVFFNNKRVEPSGDYVYDPIYRLMEARGREHLGQTNGQASLPTAPDALNIFHTGLPQPGDGNAMGTYIEEYVYDAVGNILEMQHRGCDPANPGWTRSYTYGEVSQMEASKKSNRLSSTRIGQTTEKYGYEGSEGLHGNITSMPHLPHMRWDYRDQLQATAQQVVNEGIPETTWYVYDSSGQRARKVTEGTLTKADVDAGKKPARVKERIYLGGFEIYREYDADRGKTLERESLHIMDDNRRVAIVETKTYEEGLLNRLGRVFSGPETLIRYQFDNHLGSACLELNEEAAVISYEEFFPYGSTSYQAVNKSIRAEAKRYRYTGKERDEENGFYYHGARDYAPWLGRWVSCDPLDSVNSYLYVLCSPVNLTDDTGNEPAFGPYGKKGPSGEKPVKGDHVHMVAWRTPKPGAERKSAAQYQEALATSTKGAVRADKRGQKLERAFNRAMWGTDYDENPAGKTGKVTLTATGKTVVGKTKPAVPAQWAADVQSYYKELEKGATPGEAYYKVSASRSQLQGAGAVPKRVPNAPKDVSKKLRKGQNLSVEGGSGKIMKGLTAFAVVGGVMQISEASSWGQQIEEGFQRASIPFRLMENPGLVSIENTPFLFNPKMEVQRLLKVADTDEATALKVKTGDLIGTGTGLKWNEERKQFESFDYEDNKVFYTLKYPDGKYYLNSCSFGECPWER